MKIGTINTKKLIVELMGKYSNILLLNENNIIIDALKHFTISNGANRDIMPKYGYLYPTSNKIDINNFEQLENNLNNSNLVDFFANNFTGISKTSVKQILNENNICNEPKNYKLVASHLQQLINNIENSHIKCCNFDDNDYALTYSNSIETFQVNTFLDEYYNKKQQKEQFLTYRNTVLNFIMAKLKKISKKLAGIDEKLKECSEMEKYKLYGELITNYLYQIPKQHISHIELLNYYDNNIIDIPLDVSIYPNENARKYFKKYNKLKATNDVIQTQKIELEKEINYLESIVYEIEASTCIEDVDLIYDEIKSSFTSKSKEQAKSKKANTKTVSTNYSPIVYEIDDFKVLVGKNNKQNDELTFKTANKEDIWFHVKNFHGSHVILLTNGKNPLQETINKCASIAAFHSKASNSSNVPVDYTLVKYVKKIKNSKPGMVIYTNQKTVNVNGDVSF